ncbi:hypothetical protein GQ44DRAFT_606806 [Phaeosphaeriaceae sp. PMI808]|nr:hypothetical protein GQ44DRAFT_606806 [Phaeosphaeriaceae sp. PMI808]
MFGHPGISALEYAGQADTMRKQSKSLSEVSLKHKSTASMHNNTSTSSISATTELERGEVTPPLHFIDEYGSHQRRRGTFINHTPRHFEVRPSKCVEAYRPSRADSENYSRPLSRASMASTSPAISSQYGLDPSPDIGSCLSSNMNYSSTNSHRRSFSAPPNRIVTHEMGVATSTSQLSTESTRRSTRISDHQGQETKRRRRQTPFRIVASKKINVSAHVPSGPWITEHGCHDTGDFIGDVPFDMDREVSAETGTFRILQKYFDSQGGTPALSSNITPGALSSNPPTTPSSVSPEPSLHKSFREPIAIYPIDEMLDRVPAVPDRSPRRLTNPGFPLCTTSTKSEGSDLECAADGQHLPYDEDKDALRIPKKRTKEHILVKQAAWVGSANIGKLAPPILGHDALTASSDLGLNNLSSYLKHTGPSTDTESGAMQQRKKTLRLFKGKQRKSLVARVGSVEGSPDRARNRPPVPTCAREMTTSAGTRHLKIVIPAETPSGSQVSILSTLEQRVKRHSRYMPISFTEEMLNPLAGSQVESIIARCEPPERSFSTPILRSSRSPKKSPVTPEPVPIHEHPLVLRDEQTRARKLRDLQRIKRKPVPTRTHELQHSEPNAGALPTPAHTPEPVTDNKLEDDGIEEDRLDRLQDTVVLLREQNKQLAEALARFVGLKVEDGKLKTEDVLKIARQTEELPTSI